MKTKENALTPLLLAINGVDEVRIDATKKRFGIAIFGKNEKALQTKQLDRIFRDMHDILSENGTVQEYLMTDPNKGATRFVVQDTPA